MQLIPREETSLNGFWLILSVIFAWENEKKKGEISLVSISIPMDFPSTFRI